MATCRLWPHCCGPEFRALVADTYPGLNRNPVYWKIAGHGLFGGRRHDHEEDNSHLLLPHSMVAEMVGGHPANVCVQKWIADFQLDTGILLNASDWSYPEGRARVIHPEFDPLVLAAPDREILVEARHTASGRVDFVTGQPVGRRKRSKQLAARAEAMREAAAAASENHPAQDLLRFLNEQHPGSLSYTLKTNCQALADAAEAMPAGVRKDSVLRVLHAVTERCVMIYHGTDRSPRLFAEELTINSFPREFRLLATAGDVHLDLRCAQLAIATRLMELPELREMLASGKSFWSYILPEIGLPDTYKPVVKPAIYSSLYGMTRKNLRGFLTMRMPERSAELFLSNKIVADILCKRGKAYRKIRREGGIYDAFGTWLPLEKGRAARHLFCAVAQSYELKIMMVALPVLQENKEEIHVHSWLHDSLTLAFKRQSQEAELVDRIAAAINAEAWKLGIPTEVEITR